MLTKVRPLANVQSRIWSATTAFSSALSRPVALATCQTVRGVRRVLGLTHWVNFGAPGA